MAERKRYTGERSRATRQRYTGQQDDGGGGLLGKTLTNLKDVAVNLPAGFYETGKAVGLDAADLVTKGDITPERTGRIAKESVVSIADDLRHPLRNPGYTLLDLLALGSLGAGTAARVAAVGKAGRTGGSVARAALTKPQPGPRILTVGDLEARGRYSRNAAARGVQRLSDKTLAARATPGSKAEARLQRRASKILEQNRRVGEAKARAASNRLLAIGRKLAPEEQMAIRLVAEEAPVRKRIAAKELRASQAKDAREAARHRERIDLMEKASAFLDEKDGRPVLKPGKLDKVYGLVKEVAKTREERLALIDRLTPEEAQAAKTKTGRIALGAEYVDPKTAREAVRTVERKGDLSDEDIGGVAAMQAQSGRLVGAEGFKASPEAVHIGNPVRRSRLTGKPKVGAQTIGLPRDPGSLRGMTGAAVRQSRERLDTTKIVAERGLEAVRLTGILRAREQLKKAGSPYPVRPDDMFMRLENLPSHKRLPEDVRRYLDDPGEFTVEEAGGVVDRIRDFVFTDEWRLDPRSRAEFERLAAEGKGVFVPRRVVGNLAKRDPSLADMLPRLTGFTDAVNNAQKLAAIYLKGGYVPAQLVSNAFLNLTQQGFAAIPNLARAVRLDRKLGEGTASVIDDLMGEGFLRLFAGEGQGLLARSTQGIAGTLSRVADTPFRRASFLHEARKAGYRSPDQIRRLLDDDSLADDLADVVTRANEEILDFQALSPIERNVVRRIIFVFPFLKAATTYTGRFVRDKPVQTAAYAQLAEQGQESSLGRLGELPSWLEGAIPVGADRLINPAAVSPFGPAVNFGQALSGAVTGEGGRFDQPIQFAAPAVGAAVTLATGRDALGRETEGVLPTLREELVSSLPLAGVARENIDSPLVRAIVGDRRSKTFPDEDALYRFLGGAFYPRRFDRQVLNETARRG